MSTYEQLQSRLIAVPELNVILESSRLICSVYEAVQSVAWGHSQPIGIDPTPAPILQSLLTYCYAVGIVGSADIEWAAVNDPAARYLCANHVPAWETIRSYRRRHSEALKSALAGLFKLLAHMPSETYGACSLRRMERFSPNFNFHTLAAQRISRAIEADSHALDF